MAKWGEGDPRWIVEDRADGTNVNNWHWTEKDASMWSKDKLRELLEGLKIDDDKHSCTIKKLEKIEGEASASNRKGKLIFFYEWCIKASWTGKLAGSDKKHKGSLEIPNLSEENDPDEVDIRVSAETDKNEAYELKEFIRKSGSEIVQQKLSQYIKDLQKEFSQGMILPSKDEKAAVKSPQTKNTAKEELNKPVIKKSSTKSPVGAKVSCERYTDTLTFKCRAAEIYRALTEKQMVEAFTRNPANIRAEKGEAFSLFGGTVTGKFTCLEPYSKIEMKWRFKTWPTVHHSDVVLQFEEKDDCTEMTLTQTGIPESDLERTTEGWKRYYWQSIKHTFGFGSELL